VIQYVASDASAPFLVFGMPLVHAMFHGVNIE